MKRFLINFLIGIDKTFIWDEKSLYKTFIWDEKSFNKTFIWD